MSKKLSDLKVGDEVALNMGYALDMRIVKITDITPKGFIKIDSLQGLINPDSGNMRGYANISISVLTKKLRSEICRRERLFFLKREIIEFASTQLDLEKVEAIYKIIKGERDERNN